jgi:hypothetical protein
VDGSLLSFPAFCGRRFLLFPQLNPQLWVDSPSSDRSLGTPHHTNDGAETCPRDAGVTQFRHRGRRGKSGDYQIIRSSSVALFQVRTLALTGSVRDSRPKRAAPPSWAPVGGGCADYMVCHGVTIIRAEAPEHLLLFPRFLNRLQMFP